MSAGWHIGRPGAQPGSFANGWLHTSDIVTVDPDGFVSLVDRSKDLIQSGGEWISSVDLENTIMAHPAVSEAAVIAVPQPQVGGTAAGLHGPETCVPGPGA